jgi:lysophospholipase L1-like esterase
MASLEYAPLLYHNATLHNVAETFAAPNGAGTQISRVPLTIRPHLNENAQARILRGAGSELRFNLRGESAVVTLEVEDEPGIIEVHCGSLLHSWHVVETRPTPIQIIAPERLAYVHEASLTRKFAFDPMLYRVIFPWKQIIHLHGIEGKIEPATITQTPKTRYLAYGSSITNGATSIRPTGPYAMRTAQHLKAELINLGLGGAAHCEPELADYIASRQDWDFATLEMGINMVGWASLEEFTRRVNYFVETIANAHPDKWVFCLDMFPFWRDLDSSDNTPTLFRQVIRETVQRLNRPRLVHIEAASLLRGYEGLASDMLHPSPAGMEEIAQNLANVLDNYLSSELNERD